MSFDLSDYVDVPERLRLFYERHPEGTLQGEGEFVRDEQGRIVGYVFRALAYRTPEDIRPGTGTAFEPVPGKTPYTRDSEVQNAETSAWGRAIVACGFPSKHIASADEAKARQGNGDEPDDLAEAAKNAQIPSEFPIHFGKNRGTKLGELTAPQLSWYASKWMLQETPSEYDHLLKAAATALAAGDDTPITSDPYPDVPF